MRVCVCVCVCVCVRITDIQRHFNTHTHREREREREREIRGIACEDVPTWYVIAPTSIPSFAYVESSHAKMCWLK